MENVRYQETSPLPPNPQVLLPNVPIAERFGIDTQTATGLFLYRTRQAMGLLNLPDFGGDDLSGEQRHQALLSAVSLHRPLAALSLFLGVVALEDFIRDLVARMSESNELATLFPQLASLRSKPRVRLPADAFRRLDTDPAGVIDPNEINSVFQRALGISPVPIHEYWHLRDLALLGHTVAHHAAVIRQVDLPRFGHFIVQPKQLINPPPAFVKAELHYLWKLGREVERAVRFVVFRKAIAATGSGWSKAPDARIEHLIAFFAYFGYIEPTALPIGYAVSDAELRQLQAQEAARVRAALLTRCIADLAADFGS